MQQAEYPSTSQATTPITMGHTFSTQSHQAPQAPPTASASEYFSAQTLHTPLSVSDQSNEQRKKKKMEMEMEIKQEK